jgi:type 2A phosphatase activator TIP41
MSFNGPISEPFPSPDEAEASTVSHTQHGFKISARKLPISKSGPIDDMSKKLGIPVPEMIFGDNMVSVEHVASGWRLEFNAVEALDRVDKTDKNMLKVAYSKEWSSSRFVLVASFDAEYKLKVKFVERRHTRASKRW